MKANGGLCYLAPTSYKSVDGEDKIYEVDTYYDFDKIAMIPDVLFKHIKFNIKPNTSTSVKSKKTTKEKKVESEDEGECESDSGIGSSSGALTDMDSDDENGNQYVLPSIT